MSFFTLIFKNLLRRKIRTFLTVLGISIGIATIIALGSVGEGLKESMGKILRVGGGDFIIAQSGTADLALSTVSESRVDDIRKIEGMDKVEGVYIGVAKLEEIPFFLTLGVRKEVLEIGDIKIVEGRIFKRTSQNEVMLGKVAAKNLKKKVGDEINLAGRKFKIVGIYESGEIFQDGGSFFPLKVIQRLQKKEGKISMILVKVKRGVSIEKIAQKVERDYPDELVTVKSLEEIGKVDQGTATVDGAVWVISLLAILVGGIGVMNTMIMSVFERTREIGVLRALGWKRWRILTMILGESFLVGVLGALLGIAFGLIAVKLILLSPVIKGFIEPFYPLNLFVKALAVAILVGLFGGFYPAYRASKLSPVEALRYE
ncbi:MAG: ABC transporter permease [Actinomycetota bacterium]